MNNRNPNNSVSNTQTSTNPRNPPMTNAMNPSMTRATNPMGSMNSPMTSPMNSSMMMGYPLAPQDQYMGYFMHPNFMAQATPAEY